MRREHPPHYPMILSSVWRRSVGALLFSWFLMPSALWAAGATAGERQTVVHGLTWIDWIVIVVYMVGVLYLGAHVAKRQSTNAEYFTAAKTHISPFLVGISHFAALLSTISYLGAPGEMIYKGPAVLIGTVCSIPIAYFIVSYWIIPKIMAQRVTSAYELLESRLGPTGRLMGAILFVKLRLVWMGLLVYVSATALSVILNIDLKWTPLVSFVIGIIPLIYASMGGLRAVVIANVIQFFLLLLGAVLAIVIVTIRCGGFSWWPTTWSPHWDIQPVFSWDPYVRSTVFAAMLSTVIWRVCTAGGDQMAIQHYMATRDIKATRRSYFYTSLAAVVVLGVLGVLGLALLGFFTQFPELAGEGMSVTKRADHLFPHFVSNLLPVGIAGLIVAAIIAASSGMDTGVNAVTAVVMKDFVERFGWKARNEDHRLKLTKYVSFGIGLAVVGASMLVKKVPGNFTEMTNKLANLETTTIFGLFFLALFVPCATSLGAVAGAVYGLTAASLVAFWDVITGRPAISFLYIGAVGLFFNLVAGYLVSRFGPRSENVRGSLIGGVILFGGLAVAVALLISRAT
jgi:SSS family solute:Na+ symporter